VTEYAAHPGVLDTYAALQMAPDGVGVSKFGHTKIGGYECVPGGPFGSYTWSVSGSKLVAQSEEGTLRRPSGDPGGHMDKSGMTSLHRARDVRAAVTNERTHRS